MTAAGEHTAGPIGAGPRHLAMQHADAADWRADQRAQAARSVTCPCRAQPGRPCGPAGDHLARYLRAEQSGAITRQSLTQVIAGLDVIAPHVLIQPPGERAAYLAGAHTADQVIRAQLDAGMTSGRIEASAESVLDGRYEHPSPVSDAFYRGYDDVAATCTREARELEAGGCDTIHQILTGRMIAALQRGTIPWRKPWHAATGRPRSMSTGQPYRGVNLFLLSLTAGEQSYASPFWATYRQISSLGGQVRQGERSTLVVFWKKAETEQRDPRTGEVTVRAVPLLRYYRVFNAAQADQLPDRFYPAPGEHQQISEPQAVLDDYLARGPRLVHVPGDRADYHQASDTIRLPLPSQFRTAEGYYAAAFHEAGHSTGHPHRLNRPGVAAFDHFGSGKYAREELVAEMTSAILCAHTGIDNPALFGNSAAYIANWLTALDGDRKLVITAAAHAQHATDLITQPERQSAVDPSHDAMAPAREGGTGRAQPLAAAHTERTPPGPPLTAQAHDWQAEAS